MEDPGIAPDVSVALNGHVLSPQNDVEEASVISGRVGGYNPFVRMITIESGHGNPVEGWLYFHPEANC